MRQKKMQEMGLEPTRYCYHRHLKPARLPIPPLLRFYEFLRFRKRKIYIIRFVLNCQEKNEKTFTKLILQKRLKKIVHYDTLFTIWGILGLFRKQQCQGRF